MKIIYLDVLRGNTYWFYNKKQFISLKLDLEEFDDTSIIDENFCNHLKKLLPSLYAHACLDHNNEPFFEHLNQNLHLIQVIGHIAIELQNLAGMSTAFEKGMSTREQGVYRLFFSYEIEKAGLYAANIAIKITECLAKGGQYLDLQRDIAHLSNLYEEEKLGPSTLSIVKEAEKWGIPWCKMEGESLITLGHGIYQKKIWMTVSSETSSIAVEIARDKELTKRLLESHLIPTPKGYLIQSVDELESVLDSINFPLTIKPFDGNHGRGVSCNITNKEQAEESFHLAKRFSDKIIVEQFIAGNDYRFLVINFKLVAVAERRPAEVIGTGTKTIEELIYEINQDPKRGQGHDNYLTKISIDAVTKNLLKEKNLSPQSVLPKGESLFLKYSANISTGGTAKDVTDLVHPYNKKYAERIARIIHLDICGIDAILQNIKEPMNENNSAILEINAAPGLRMHLAPSIGEPKPVAASIIDTLFPSKKANIPIIAVTGTNGKTTVVRLIAHIARHCQKKVGFTTTEGVYIDDELVFKGDCSGPGSAKAVLLDPFVDFAVLECARGGILREGLAFDSSDISIITNISADHLGLEDVHTLEELTRVKALIAYKTKQDGFAILNADDKRVYALKDQLNCHVALFGLKKNNKIDSHCQQGGIAAYISKNMLMIMKDNQELTIAPLKEIPLSFNGRAELMIKNILPATLASLLSGFSMADVSKALKQFTPSEKLTPGRMNLYQFKDFKLMLDYAHNQGGFIEIKKYLASLVCSKKIGIISAVGDRRAKDTQTLGFLSAQMFDEIIIKHNKDCRGRTNESQTSLLLAGIQTANVSAKVKIISNEYEALDYAIQQVIPNTFIFYVVDDVFLALDYINNKIKRRELRI